MSDKPVKVKHILNSPKIRLNAPCPTARGKISTLSWDTYMNNPRIVVKVNDPAFANPEKSYGNIQAAMEPPTFYFFLQLLDMAIVSEGQTKNKLELRSTSRGNPNETVVTADVWIGKDGEGCVFVSVIKRDQEGWPVIKFVFGPPDERFVKVFKADGTEYTKAELSVGYGRAYYKLLENAMANVLDSKYVEPPPYIPGNKGGYSGNNNRGGYGNNRSQNSNYGGGGGNSQPPSDDFGGGDSLPF
ncbi:MAG: hypothetical protein PHQ58_04300 [Rhodoferax sp.]|uniref:hypothetical protein n=1 Tax=Rhodoferax sp. TaxID=50421 RepID=UPI00262BA86E|nr:hypothetical protein [Rhodoferax sp.]MDD2879636.1 hypothetical protein [Rhodoferax sp.]